jgi:hypothetical protein
MNRRPWSRLVLGIAVFSMIPLMAATNSARTSEPWPAMLSDEPASIDPSVAALQLRASESLEKLVLSADLSE